jgi:hypothetical protein
LGLFSNERPPWSNKNSKAVGHTTTGGFAFSPVPFSGKAFGAVEPDGRTRSLARLRRTKHTLNALARKRVCATMEPPPAASRRLDYESRGGKNFAAAKTPQAGDVIGNVHSVLTNSKWGVEWAQQTAVTERRFPPPWSVEEQEARPSRAGGPVIVHATNVLDFHENFTTLPSIEVTHANRATPTAVSADPKKLMATAAIARTSETRTYICSGA